MQTPLCCSFSSITLFPLKPLQTLYWQRKRCWKMHVKCNLLVCCGATRHSNLTPYGDVNTIFLAKTSTCSLFSQQPPSCGQLVCHAMVARKLTCYICKNTALAATLRDNMILAVMLSRNVDAISRALNRDVLCFYFVYVQLQSTSFDSAVSE